MRVISLVLLALGVTFSIIPSSTATILGRADRQPDSVTIKAWEKTGSCFSYFDLNDADRAARPCPNYCRNVKHKEGPTACRGPVQKKEQVDKSIIWPDDDGNLYTPGVCICEGIAEVAEVFMDIVIQGLEKLDKIVCSVFLSAFDTIIQTGLMIVPGGFEAKIATEGAKRAVQGAKSILENGGDAANFFGGWVGPACGMPEWHFDITMVFAGLINAPDSMGTSIGCVRRNKKDCKKIESKPDKDKDKDKGKPDDKKTTANPPATTDAPAKTTDAPSKTTDAPSKTTSADSCRATGADKDSKGGKGKGSKLRRASIASILGPGPNVKDYMAFAKHCPGKASKRDLQVRAKPAGYREVEMGKSRATKKGDKGLWSGGFGTCVGFIVTGKPEKKKGFSGHMLHLSLGTTWEDIRLQWNPWVEAVEHEQLRDMKGYIYTVDTDHNQPDFKDHPDMWQMLTDLEETYRNLEGALQGLIGTCSIVSRKTHPWGPNGEMTLSPDGDVGFL